MDKKESLTNEKLRKKFKSQFELVNYAIKLAENMIYSGRATRIKTDIQNRALQIIAEIDQGKDQFDEIHREVRVKEETNNVPVESSNKRFSESKKKTREVRR